MDLSDPYSDSSLPPLHTRYPQPVPQSSHHMYYVKQEYSYPPPPPSYHRAVSTPSASSASHYHSGHSPLLSPTHSVRHAAVHDQYTASTPSYSSSSALSSPDEYYVQHEQHHHPHPHYNPHQQHQHHPHSHSPPPPPIVVPVTSVSSTHTYSPNSQSHTDSYEMFGSSTDSLPLPLPLDDEPVYAVHHNHPHIAVAVPPPVVALGPPPSSPPPAAKRRSRAQLFSPRPQHDTAHYNAISPPPGPSMPYPPAVAGGPYYAVSPYNDHTNESYSYAVDSSLQDEAMAVEYPHAYPAAVPVHAGSPPPLLPPLPGGELHPFAPQEAVAAIVVRSESPPPLPHHSHELMEGEGSVMHVGEVERETIIRQRPLSPSRVRSYSQADIHSLHHQQQRRTHHRRRSHQHHGPHPVTSHQQSVAYYDDGRRVDVYRVDSSHGPSHHKHSHQHSHPYNYGPTDTNGVVEAGHGHSILTSPVNHPPPYSSYSSQTSPRHGAPASLSVLHQLQAEISAATNAGADSAYIAAKIQQAKDVQRAIMQETMAGGGGGAMSATEGHSTNVMYDDSGSASTSSSPHSHASSLGRSSPCQHGRERHSNAYEGATIVHHEPVAVKHEMTTTHRERERERDRERAMESGWVDAQHHHSRGHQYQHTTQQPHSHPHSHNIPTVAYIAPTPPAVVTFTSPVHSPSAHSTPSPPASVSTASSSDSRPRYSPFPSHAPPPHPPGASAYPQSNFAVPPPPVAARSNKRTRSRSEGYSADAHVPGLPAHTHAAHMGGMSVSSQGRDRPATATHHYYHHHHHSSHSQPPSALAVPHHPRAVSSHGAHSTALLSPSAGAVSSAAPFSSLRAVQEHEHDDALNMPYHVESELRSDSPPAPLSLPAATSANVISTSYLPLSTAQQRSSARTFSAPHTAILVDSGDRYHAHMSAPSTPIHSPHYAGPQPTSYSAAASPANRRVIVKARSSSNASSAPVLAPSPAYTVSSAGSSGEEVPTLRLHGQSRPSTGESGNVRSSSQCVERPSHHAGLPTIDTQLETQSHPSPYGSRQSSPTSSAASSTPPPFRSPTHRPFSFARASSPRHGILTTQVQSTSHQSIGGNEWKVADRPAQSVSTAAAVRMDDVTVKEEPMPDPVSSASGYNSFIGAGLVAQDSTSAYSSMEINTPYSSSTASTATSSNPPSTSASPLASPLQLITTPSLSDSLSMQPPLRFSLSAATPSTPIEQPMHADEDDESLEHPSPLLSSSRLSLSAPSDSPLKRAEAGNLLPSQSPLSTSSNASTASSTASIPPLTSTTSVPAPSSTALTSGADLILAAAAASASSSTASSSQTTKKSRKKRRKSTDLPEHERWYCPLQCGKYFRRTSSRSITEHMKNCPSIKKKVEPDATGSMAAADQSSGEAGSQSTDATAVDGGDSLTGNGLTVTVESEVSDSVGNGSGSGSGGLFSPVTGGLSSAMKELHLQPFQQLEARDVKMDATGQFGVGVAGDDIGGSMNEPNRETATVVKDEDAVLASDDDDEEDVYHNNLAVGAFK